MLKDGPLGLVPEFQVVPFHPPRLEIRFADPILGRSGEFGTRWGPQRCRYGRFFFIFLILIDWDGLMGCTWRVHVQVLSIGVDMLPGSSWLWKRGSMSVSAHVDGQYILVYFL
jgi:hypothetical protein